LRPDRVDLMREVASEVFRNAQRHSSTGVRQLFSVRMKSVRFGGDQHTVLTFRSIPRADLDVSFLLTAYRAPLPDSAGGKRPHLGCFTIGQVVRSLSGNAFMDITEDGVLQTHFILPDKEIWAVGE
jgi:hypothetical protein